VKDLTAEFTEAGLLDGLDGREREARLALLEDLAAAGVSAAEMQEALAEDRLALLPVERILAGEPLYTPREVAERAGVPLDFLLAMRMAVGLARPDPDERSFDDQDLDSARAFARLREAGLPDESLIEVSRVLGSGLSQTAEAMRTVFARMLLEEGADERQLASRTGDAVRELLPLMSPLMDHTLRLHLRDQVRNQQIGQGQLVEGAARGVRYVWIGFADMVGFTRLGERVDVVELGGLVTRLGDLALAAVTPPVRLVKTVGDAAMFVSPGAEPLVETVLSLVERAEREHDFPELRGGLAGGVALSRGGDWYGPPVNLANRVTGVARPGSVLATREVRDSARDRYNWSYAGEWKLRGFKQRLALYRVRRREGGSRSGDRAG
jgi:adenylate cyclase